ncbi:MAG: cell division protein ZapE, partial [Colwellia sp.]
MKHAYQELLTNKQLDFDTAQTHAVDALILLSEQLLAQQQLPEKLKKNIPGLYFHGRVGRGKTMLMDLFYQHLAIKNKKRIHFHHFMESIHQQLAKLTGQSEPLTCIAKAWATDIDLLCFDEFFVSDIGDAMLLSGLFSALFAQGVTLVATSNCKPEQLYRNGLQRERFLPTITLINQYCQVVSIDGEIDHRRSKFTKNTNYNNYFLLANQGNT